MCSLFNREDRGIKLYFVENGPKTQEHSNSALMVRVQIIFVVLNYELENHSGVVCKYGTINKAKQT